MAKAAQAQKSLFDKAEEYKGNFIVSLCPFDKARKDWCKNWDGKGSDAEGIDNRKCPTSITEENCTECKFYVTGILSRAATKKSKKQ